MSPVEELPPDDVTRGQRSFVLWLVVIAGAALGAYFSFATKESQCFTGPQDDGYCTSFTPVHAIVLGVACLALAAYGVLKLVRR